MPVRRVSTEYETVFNTYPEKITNALGHSITYIRVKRGQALNVECRIKTHPATEKKIAIYFLKCLTPLTNNQIGKIFGVSFSAASKAAKTITTFIDKDADVRRAVEKINSTFKA